MKRLLEQFFKIEKDELPVVLLLFSFFFLSIAIFQILKPLKNGLFIETYGADTELYAKLANILVAALGVGVFTYLYSRFGRRTLVFTICGFFVAVLLTLIYALREPGALTIWGFYLLGDLVSTMLVAAFWAYATDVATSDQAKRLFGAVGAGGVLGGWIGIAYARFLLEQIGMEGLLISCAALMVLIAAVTAASEFLIPRTVSFRPKLRAPEWEAPEPEASTGSSVLEGAVLALRSPYLAAIVGIMFSYEIASQVMDYQFKSLTEELSGLAETQQFMATIYLFANLLSVVVQLLLVSFVMRRFGLVVTLLVMPVAILLSSLSFMAVPILWVSGLLVISDNGLNYSIQQTGRETLYVITTPEEKYKARAFTNMFVQRVAKGSIILALLGLASFAIPLRYLSLLTIAVVIAMVFFSVYAGRVFNRTATELEERKAA